MRRFSILLLGFVFNTCVAATPATGLKKFIDPIDTIKANFVQNVYNKNDQVVQSAAGIMEFKRPNQFRWHIVDPDPNLVVTDGQTLWNYDEMLAQVTVEKFDSKKEVSPLSFLFEDPEKHFKVEELNATAFKLTPIVANQNFKYLEVFFKQGKITQLHMYDNLDQVTVFDFMQVQNNVALDKARFSFTPPAGVDVIGEQ